MKFLSDYFNSGTVKQQNKKRFGALLICITAALLAVALIALMIASIATAIKGKAPHEEDPEDTDGSGIPSGYTTTTFDQAQLSAGTLLLLDETHTYTGPAPSQQPTPDQRPKSDEGVDLYRGDHGSIRLTQETLDAFNTMMIAFHNDNKADEAYSVGNIWLQSRKGTYSASTEALLQTGMALILCSQERGTENDEVSIYSSTDKGGVGVYDWFYDHAHEYGFIQASTAEGEENIFRYVGVAHATYMKNNNKTLAEYLDILQTRTAGRPLSVQVNTKNADGQTTSVAYNIYHLTAEETPVVPQKFTYTVSGDNMGGYIVTVNRSSATSNQ